MTSAPRDAESSHAPETPGTPENPAESRSHRTHRRRRRRVLIAGITAGTLALGAGSAVAVSAYKTVTLDVDGETRTVSSFAGSVDGLLAEADVALTDRDIVSPSPDAPLQSGSDVVVRTAKELDVEIDGEQDTTWVNAVDANEALSLLAERGSDVALVASRDADRAALPLDVHAGEPVAVVHAGEVEVVDGSEQIDVVLDAAGATADDDDIVTVIAAADAGIDAEDLPQDTDVPQLAVVVQDVEVELVTRIRAIEHETETTESDDRFEDLDPAVETEGEDGSRTVVREITTIDGEEVSNERISSVVTHEPVTEVLVQGTKERPEPEPEPAAESSGSSDDAGSDDAGSSDTAGYSGSNRQIGQQMAADRGWTGEQWSCLENLWTKESNWSHTVANPSSGAYGIPQSLPGSKMASHGSDWQSNPATQIAWGLDYISGRYGTPCGAWGHSQANNWY